MYYMTCKMFFNAGGVAFSALFQGDFRGATAAIAPRLDWKAGSFGSRGLSVERF